MQSLITGSCEGRADDVARRRGIEGSASTVWRRVRLPRSRSRAPTPGADLQQFPAENILERLAQQLGFGRQQAAPEWRRPTRLLRAASRSSDA